MTVRFSSLQHSRLSRPLAVLWLLGLFMAATVFSTTGLQAQTTVVIGNNDGTINLPIDRYYNHSAYESIYLASEIANEGIITSLGFYRDGGSDLNPIQNVSIYLKHTADEAIDNGEYSLEDYTLVFEGDYPNDATSGWMQVDLMQPFAYNGTDNLQILIIKGYQDWLEEEDMVPVYQASITDLPMARFRSNDDEIPSYLITDMYTVYIRSDIILQIEPPVPMSFNSATTVQVMGNVGRGSYDNAVVRAVVMMDGSVDPLSATSLSFNTEGTSNLGIISNARLWYSGSNKRFSTEKAVQLGSTIAVPNGTLTFDIDHELVPGANNFWLTYDVSEKAKLGEVVDAEFLSVVVNGDTYEPDVMGPKGNRPVGLVYCQPMYENDCSGGDFIDYVGFGDFKGGTAIENYGSGCNGEENSYIIYPEDMFMTTVYAGQEYPIELQATPDFDEGFGVWIDFNQNDSYDDAGEFVFASPYASTELFTGSVLIPSDAKSGKTRMRVRAAYNSTLGEGDACTLFSYGETEEYTIDIQQPGRITIAGNGAFGSVGKEQRRTIRLTNPSDQEAVSFSNWSVSGSTGFKVYQAGTNTALPQTFVIAPQQTRDFDIVFGTQGTSAAGQNNGTLTMNNNGLNNPTTISLTGFYASLTATEGATDLLVPGVKFNVGGLQPGAGQISKEIRLSANSALPAGAPIVINSYTLTGADASLFSISTLPAGIIGDNLISVSLRELGAAPGTKNATLTINHSGANGPVTVIQIEGRIGQPVVAAPTLVMLPPVALGQTYSSSYENARLIPITRAGVVDVQFFQTPQLTGSGASRMELLSNSGFYFLRGQFGPGGTVVVGGDGDIANPANWVDPTLYSITATETQPLLLAVRMKTVPAGAPTGSYDASMVLSNGSGSGVSNAVNILNITVVGEVLNDPQRVAMYPGQIAFGSVPVATSLGRTLTLRNQSGVAGMATLTITGNDFSFAGGQRSTMVMLPDNNAAVTLDLFFNPMSSGASNGVVTASGVINGTVALSGSGQAANPGNLQILIDGQDLSGIVNFGNVAVGDVGSKTVTVVNNNVGPVTISSIGRSGANATQFAVIDPMTWEIPGNGGSVSFTVKFIPTSLSNPQKDATITIYNSTGVPKGLNVRGTAVNTGGSTVSVTLTPANYNFGNQSGTYTFVLNNMGGSAVTVSGALILGSSNFTVTDAASSFPRTVSAGGSTSITVMFNGTMGANGSRSGSLVVITPGVSPYPTSTLVGMVGTSILGQGTVQTTVTGESRVGAVESYPNPVEGIATLRYELSEAQSVVVRVYDELGREVMAVPTSELPAGVQTMSIDMSNQPAGRYFIKLEGQFDRAEGRMIKIR